MSNILVVKQGSRVGVSNSNISIELEDDKYLIPCNEIEAMIIENIRCSMSAAVIVMCSNNHIPIIYCDDKHTPAATTNSFYSYYKQTTRIQEQILWTSSRKANLFYKIIRTKIVHQINVLNYFDNNNHKILKLTELLQELKKDNVISTESIVARVYFKQLYGDEFKRHENDYINFLLNYGYAILRSKIRQVIVAKGLHPSLGIVHNNQFNNYNLSDDIIEVYRPIIDYLTLIIIKSEFDISKSKEILQEAMLQNVVFNGYTVSFSKSVELFVDEIIKYMNKESKDIILPELEISKYEYQV